MPEAVVGSAEPCLKIAGVANVDGAIATVQKNGHGTRRIRARLALSAAGAGSAPAAFGLIPLGGSPSDRAAGPGSGQPEGAGGGGPSRIATCLRRSQRMPQLSAVCFGWVGRRWLLLIFGRPLGATIGGASRVWPTLRFARAPATQAQLSV